jgi:hypothetical protein
MILISLDSSILIDTSIHRDPYRCFVPIEQPEAFRKRLKMPLPKNDSTGLERAMILCDWIYSTMDDILRNLRFCGTFVHE